MSLADLHLAPRWLLLALGASLALEAHSEVPGASSAAASAGHPMEVSILDSRRIDFVSRVNHHRYSLDVALPDLPPPPGGYPVIYVFDGARYFASVVEAVRANDNFPQAIVVGLSYPRDPAWAESVLARHQPLPPEEVSVAPFKAAENFERMYDLAPRANAKLIEELRKAQWVVAAADTGGIDGFLQTIETEVKPRVQALAPVNASDQTVFGHSLGGLAVVEALFTEPQAFRNFVAASPSIAWSDHAVLERESQFEASVRTGKAAPRVLITVGDGFGDRSMIDDACGLASRLKELRSPQRMAYEVADCVIFTRQDHGISPWPAIGRAVAFAAHGP